MKAVLTKVQLRQPLATFLNDSLAIMLSTASAKVVEFCKVNSSMRYSGDGCITTEMYAEANCIINDGTLAEHLRFVELNLEEKERLHPTKYANLKVYIINSYSGRSQKVDASRRAAIVQCLAGEWHHPFNMTANKLLKQEKLWMGFQLITIERNCAATRVNPFLFGLPINRKRSPFGESPIRVESLSAAYYFNGNVDSEMVALLHLIGHIDVHSATTTLVARRLPGRPRKSKGWFDKVLDQCKSTEEKILTLESKLKCGRGLQFWGYNVVLQSGDDMTLGFVQTYKHIST
ncbi:MAG: hypothetical protein ACRDL7_14630, partial [Gaiellaceae bacterium]